MLSDGWARRSVDAFDDAEVALEAVGEGDQRLLVCLALVCRDGLFKAVELDQNDALCDSGLVGDDSTATGQSAPAPSPDSRTGQLVVGSQPLRVGNGAQHAAHTHGFGWTDLPGHRFARNTTGHRGGSLTRKRSG